MTYGLPLATPAQESLIVNVGTGAPKSNSKYTYVGDAQVRLTSGEKTKVVYDAEGKEISYTLVLHWMGVSDAVAGVTFKTFYDCPDKGWAVERDVKALGVAREPNGDVDVRKAFGSTATATITLGKPKPNGKQFQVITKFAPPAPASAGPTIL